MSKSCIQERLAYWANNLTPEQLREVVVEMVGRLIENEEIAFHDEALVPYWRSCGDSIVTGQEWMIPD